MVLAHVLGRVEVADREDRAAVLDGPLDEAAAGREVHHVVLVDPGRAAQQRPGVDLLGLRRVLDELHELVAEHDLARGRGEVAAHLEAAGVDLARPAVVVDQVVEEGHRALDDARARGVERPLQGGRVQREEVRGRQRVEREVEGELGLLGDVGLDGRGTHHVVGVPARRQVGQPHAVEQRVRAPRRVGEPAVLRVDRHGRLDLAAEPRGGGDHRDAGEVRPPLQGGAGRGGRVGQARLQRSGQGLTEAGGIEVLEQIGLRCQYPCSSLGDIARRLIHHASILRGKPPTSHPLPLTGISHACHLRKTRSRADSTRCRYCSSRPTARSGVRPTSSMRCWPTPGPAGACSGWTCRCGTTTPPPR